MLPAEPPPVVQSCWLLLPPSAIEPVVELLVIAPQVSTMSTYWPVSVVVVVPLVQLKMPPLLVKLLGEARPVSANGIGQPVCMVPQVCGVGQMPVSVNG